MTIVYTSGVVSNGQALTADDVANAPTVYVTPTTSTASSFASGNLFTLMLADIAALGNPDPQGDYRHFLMNGVSQTGQASSSNLTFIPSGGTVITK